ncbi:MAG: GlsB/YeaQ/YmgE family stress response membrane protein [Carbonactinosporaceae bacterium]
MELISTIIGLIIIGLVVGAVARLVIPGRNPMSMWLTIGIGIVGSLVGGLVTRAVLSSDSWGISLVVGVIIAVILVLLLGRSRAET